MDVSEFDYHLPAGHIAQSAIEPRDASRLLVAATLDDRMFRDLPDLLEEGDLLVVNRTRVRRARLGGVRRETGGVVEVLLTKRGEGRSWEAMIRSSNPVRTGTVIDFPGIIGTTTSEPERGIVTIDLESEGDVDDLLAVVGTMPLPPYFHGVLDDDERYQTIFAKEIGSAAAPTASLHFTPRLLSSLHEAGVATTEIGLEVGLDTFRPMAEGEVDDHTMHRERFNIPDLAAAHINSTSVAGGRVIAVGTTVVRALESSVRGDEVIPTEGETDLFIRPGYRPQVVDALITNFHAPRTTLLVLVASLLGDRWQQVYQHAIASGYRFLSFGDAMLIDIPTNR